MANVDHSKFPDTLPKELHGPFLDWGLSDGEIRDDIVGCNKNYRVKVQDLLPSQREISLGKALSIAIDGEIIPPKDSNLGAVISLDNYILDGHHRWAACMLTDPRMFVIGTKIALPMKDLLPILRNVGDAFGNARNKFKGDPSDNIFKTSVEIAKKMFEDDGSFEQGKAKKLENRNKWLMKINKDKQKSWKQIEERLKMMKNVFPSNAPARVDMPVINAHEPIPDYANVSRKDKNELDAAVRYFRTGRIDIYPPYKDRK